MSAAPPIAAAWSPRLRRVLRAAPWWIAAVGIAVRLAWWASARSLWLDETYVGRQVVTMGSDSLLETVLASRNSPPLWILAEYGLSLVAGMEERALRLPSLLGSIATLLLAVPLARRLLRPSAVPLALLLLAFSHTAIYYAQDLKPYATDMAICTAFVLAGLRLLERVPAAGPCAALAAAGALAPWYSYTSALVLAGIGTLAFATAIRRRDRGGALRLVAVGVVWVASLAAMFAFIGKSAAEDEFLQEFWDAGFLPVTEGPLQVLLWCWEVFPTSFSEISGLRYGALAAPLFLAGVLTLRRRAPWRLAILLAPLAWCLLASALRVYPFRGRVVVFLVPVFLLPVAAGALAVRFRGATAWRRAPAGVFALLLLAWPAASAVARCFDPPERQESRHVFQRLREVYRPGDVVYLHLGSEPAWLCYRDRFGLGDIQPHVGPRGRRDPTVHLEDLRTVCGNPRVWVVLSNWWWHDTGDERAIVLGYLEGLGNRLESFRWSGAELHLYDLATPPLDRGASLRVPLTHLPDRPVEEPQADERSREDAADPGGGAGDLPAAGEEPR